MTIRFNDPVGKVKVPNHMLCYPIALSHIHLVNYGQKKLYELAHYNHSLVKSGKILLDLMLLKLGN